MEGALSVMANPQHSPSMQFVASPLITLTVIVIPSCFV